MAKIEIRLHIDPLAHRAARGGILSGLHDYLNDTKLDASFYDCYWEDAAKTERRLLNQRGQVNITRYMDLLSTEKENIANGSIEDKPHWDFVITSRDLCPEDTLEYNFVFGGSQGVYSSGLFDLASVVVSTFRLADKDLQKGFARGKLVGYHELSHLQGTEHCDDRRCVYHHGLGGLDDLDFLVDILLDTKKIPKCPSHKAT